MSALPAPFAPATGPSDEALAARAASGDADALDALVRRHQRWLFHVAVRLVLNPADAEDLAQETLLKAVTRLAQFEGRSAFRTWLYRILMRGFLDGKRRKMEQAITTFSAYGEELEAMPNAPLHLTPALEPDRALLVEEAKVGCMVGMLLCLDRDQRAAYVLGEIAGAPSPVAAEILGIRPAAYRKRLERARRDITAFMNERCGLQNPANPCRCSAKTRTFIAEGWVDPERLKFTARRVAAVRAEAREHHDVLCTAEERFAAVLFRGHPVLPGPDLAGRLRGLLEDPELRARLALDA